MYRLGPTDLTGLGEALQETVPNGENKQNIMKFQLLIGHREFELRANSPKNAIKIKPASISYSGLGSLPQLLLKIRCGTRFSNALRRSAGVQRSYTLDFCLDFQWFSEHFSLFICYYCGDFHGFHYSFLQHVQLQGERGQLQGEQQPFSHHNAIFFYIVWR